jgi:hypothetical protein
MRSTWVLTVPGEMTGLPRDLWLAWLRIHLSFVQHALNSDA